jgi:hypothetical protein
MTKNHPPTDANIAAITNMSPRAAIGCNNTHLRLIHLWSWGSTPIQWPIGHTLIFFFGGQGANFGTKYSSEVDFGTSSMFSGEL